MKILLINQVFYPEPAATGQYLTDLALALVERGCDVTVLAGQRGYAEPHLQFSASEIYHGIKIIRVWPFSFGRGHKILRFLDALFLNIAFALKIFFLPRFDSILALTSPPLVASAALAAARLRGSRLNLWMMDINPDEAIEAGWLRKNSLRAQILEAALRQVLKRSRRIVVLDHFMRDRILAKGAAAEKIAVIPPWSGEDELEPVPHEENPFRKKYASAGRFVVMYSGNFSVCHPLETLLQAAEILKEDPAFLFLFIGGGARASEVLRFKEERGLANLICLPYQERSQLKYSLSAADLHAVTMGNPYVGIVHPSKIYGILKVGRPFVYVGPRVSAIGELIAENRVGYQVEHGRAERLAEIIREVRSIDAAGKKEIEARAERLAQKFSREILVREFTDFLFSAPERIRR